jgi:uncharacterized membrane protein HdeD (DUF308 family)
MAATMKPQSLSGHERIFVARGVLAIVFALSLFVGLAIVPYAAVRIFAVFSIIDGVLCLFSGRGLPRSWTSPRRSALFAEGLVECAFGIFLMFGSHGAPIVALAIAANAIIGGASASVYSFGDKDERSANWWALYGITGVILGFAVGPLSAAGIPAILIAVGIVAVIQGVTRMFLRGGPYAADECLERQ